MDRMTTTRAPLTAFALACALVAGGAASGCTFEPGGWFGSLRPSLTAAYQVRADRDAGPGWQMLSNDYQVRVSGARLALAAIRLLAAPAGAEARFDPARPPPGYSLCHNGHCHAADGSLVPYREIEAQLAGAVGGAERTAVLTLPVEGALDLLVPETRSLPCEPSCNLDRSRIVGASAAIAVLAMEGSVRDLRQPPRLPETPFRLQLGAPAATGEGAAAGPPVLETDLDIPLDRASPPGVTVDLAVELSAALFDGVDFAALPAPAGALDVAAAGATLRRNLAEGRVLTATVARHPD